MGIDILTQSGLKNTELILITLALQKRSECHCREKDLGSTWGDRDRREGAIEGGEDRFKKERETDCRGFNKADKWLFIYHPVSLMTDNLHLGDQGCHPNRQKRERGRDEEK